MLDVHEGSDVVLDAEDGLPENTTSVISQRVSPLLPESSDLSTDPARPSLHHLLEFHTHEEPSAHGLCPGDQLGQAVIPHFLQGSQQASLEEHLEARRMPWVSFLEESLRDHRSVSVGTDTVPWCVQTCTECGRCQWMPAAFHTPSYCQ